MAGWEPVEVTVQVGGQDMVAGTLWIHERGGQSATFRYADEYLSSPDSYDLDPALPRAAGLFHTPAGKAMFSAFADSAPDRWGENLMRRAERERARSAGATPRSLRQADFLLGVRDDARQGAVRFRQPGSTTYYSSRHHAVPRLIELPRLLNAVDHLDAEGLDRDLKDLIDAGSSLGGARPKAAVIDASGQLAIAKFPRAGSDEWDVSGWEELELSLARRAGLAVTESELVRIGGRHVLIVDRFDRTGGQRTGFASALTMLEAVDGEQRSYLEIAEVIERHSPQPTADLQELYRRIMFSILTGNTDDHLRNHAFLRQRRGWALSPAYDLNPNPDAPERLSTAIDLDDTRASIDTALSVSGYFRLSLRDAKSAASDVEQKTSGWRSEAIRLGLPGREIDKMTSAFDTSARRAARAAASERLHGMVRPGFIDRCGLLPVPVTAPPFHPRPELFSSIHPLPAATGREASYCQLYLARRPPVSEMSTCAYRSWAVSPFICHGVTKMIFSLVWSTRQACSVTSRQANSSWSRPSRTCSGLRRAGRPLRWTCTR
jgi:serine/threonine-protein kinase HipA